MVGWVGIFLQTKQMKLFLCSSVRFFLKFNITCMTLNLLVSFKDYIWTVKCSSDC